jgi:hypothetical protein
MRPERIGCVRGLKLRSTNQRRIIGRKFTTWVLIELEEQIKGGPGGASEILAPQNR